MTRSAWLDRPLAGYCAICEQPVLYVMRVPSPTNKSKGPGDILDAKPHPNGRFQMVTRGRWAGRVEQSETGPGWRTHRCPRAAVVSMQTEAARG